MTLADRAGCTYLWTNEGFQGDLELHRCKRRDDDEDAGTAPNTHECECGAWIINPGTGDHRRAS